MRHLTTEQLVDFAEGVETEFSSVHVRSCGSCRQQLADLRGAMSLAAEADAAEPSPLFWDHFSARVHDAVAVEHDADSSTLGRLATGVAARLASLGTRVAVVGGLAILIVTVTAIFNAGRLVPALARLGSGPAIVEAPNDADLVVDDPSLSLVADLAADLDWDASREAGLTTHVGVDDDALSELTSGERRELRRLLQGELSPSRRGA